MYILLTDFKKGGGFSIRSYISFFNVKDRNPVYTLKAVVNVNHIRFYNTFMFIFCHLLHKSFWYINGFPVFSIK